MSLIEIKHRQKALWERGYVALLRPIDGDQLRLGDALDVGHKAVEIILQHPRYDPASANVIVKLEDRKACHELGIGVKWPPSDVAGCVGTASQMSRSASPS
jgi:hypothetical protein